MSTASHAVGFPGSPPQVRGKQVFVHAGQPVQGITPAGAGKTQNSASAFRAIWDHPRRCGENPNAKAYEAWQEGSPPQVRGKPEGISKYGDYGRITPAGAGKTGIRILATAYV